MCGIAGILTFDKDKPIESELLWKMIKRIIHRGPDAQKVWSNHGVGLAHARLSIIDLDERSNQPMHDLETGRIIVFNGEVYNYIELRKELIELGYRFHTNSDTEVILKSYDHWGVECLNKFNGMWAFAIYDSRKKELFAARDRFGVKPFVYAIRDNKDLIFASEHKAIITAFPEFKQPNSSFLIDFIERDFFACYTETFYRNIYNLLPGHYFIVKNGDTPNQIRYWQWKPKVQSVISNDIEVVEIFKFLLEDSIRLRMRSDVGFGSCLSGGLDSSTIVGLASKLSGSTIKTFSCTYPELPSFDESKYIDDIIRRFNANFYFTTPRHDDFIQTMYDSVEEQDGPTDGPSILSQRAVMQLAKDKTIVLLDGQGADEVLGGYHGYFYYSLMSSIRAKRRSKGVFKAWLEYIRNNYAIKTRTGKNNWTFPQLLKNCMNVAQFGNFNVSKQSQLNAFEPFEGDDLNTILLEHTFKNLPNLLHYEDRNSMLFSLETRLPYLDYRLVEYAFSLPFQYKIRGKTTKWLLFQVAKDLLPSSILHRKDKMGYSTPGHQWFCESKNKTYFRKYFSKTNELYNIISENHRNCLSNAWNIVYNKNKLLPGDMGYVNILWKFITANMWLEKINYEI